MILFFIRNVITSCSTWLWSTKKQVPKDFLRTEPFLTKTLISKRRIPTIFTAKEITILIHPAHSRKTTFIGRAHDTKDCLKTKAVYTKRSTVCSKYRGSNGW